MVKRWQNRIIILVAGILALALTTILLLNAEGASTIIHTTSSSLTLDSMLYTGVDDLSVNPNKGSLKEGDVLVTTSENGLYKLYFNEELCIFKVENTKTGYIYASALDEINENTCTEFYSGFLSSSFSIYYYQYLDAIANYDLNTVRSWITKGTKHKAKEKESLPEEEKDLIGLKIADATKYNVANIPNGKKVTITFANAKELNSAKSFSLGITISFYVTLDNEGLHVNIPRNEIIEESSKYLLAGISVLPMMGATYNNETPGYMVIPDGSGALIRYGSMDPSSASALGWRYYGADKGSQSQNLQNEMYYINKELSAPIFGFVNGVNQDGLLGILESGSTFADLSIYPCGTYNMKENVMFPTFITRQTYYLYGINLKLVDDLYNDDYGMTYRFLSNADANYVGIANSYQDYLVAKGLLTRNSSNQYKTQIDILMSDAETSVLGYKNVTVTSLKDTKKIIGTLQNVNIPMMVVLKGWSNKGYSGATPYELKYNTKVGSKAAFKKYLASLKEDGIDAYLYDNYTIGYDRGSVGSNKTAISLLRLRMSYEDDAKELFKEYHYLYPSTTNSLAKKVVKRGTSRLGLNGLALDSIGNKLFSYYQSGTMYTRKDCLDQYLDAVSTIQGKYETAFYQPNSYMWKYTNTYLDMDVYANPIYVYTDNIPLIPYILKGYIDYFGPYLNFNSVGEIGILRYLDYGCLPSYILTDSISHELKYTDAVDYFTTAFSDWKDEIVRVHEKYEAGFNATLASKVVSRIVPEVGVSIVTYQNLDSGAYQTLIINYTTAEKEYMSVKVAPQSYQVVGGRYV